ncbi:MAG: hypothetical protein MJY45_04380 [Bacteroidales bacterium]|nr:hypothetical protein [Bacteroidales bacterium]
MKKFLYISTLILALFCIFSICAGAQAKITTRKVKLSDFGTKVTKVVLTGSDIYDQALRAEITRRWHVSPYEFISGGEYAAVRNSDKYYFLLTQDSRARKESEPGITVLSLEKGGPDDPKAPNETFEVVSMPLCAAEDPDGREYLFLPAMLDIIQQFALDAMQSDRVGYGGLGVYAESPGKLSGRDVYFAESDVSPDVVPDQTWEARSIFIIGDSEADDIFAQGKENAVVSYTVTPTAPEKNSYCYRLLISADTHELFLCRRNRAGATGKAGFQQADFKFIKTFKKK